MNQTQYVRLPRKSYTNKYKISVLIYAEIHGVADASQRFQIHHSMIYRWLAKSLHLLTENPKSRRTGTPGRKPLFKNEEALLYEWIMSQRAQFMPVSYSDIQHLMLELVGHQRRFKASLGWLYGFLKRYNLSLRTVTKSLTQKEAKTQKAAEMSQAEKVNTFHEYMNEQIATHNIPEDSIINVDQTPVWLNMNDGRKTVDVKGASAISALRPDGSHRAKVSVILACTQSGKKLPPAVVFQTGKKKGFVEHRNGIHAYHNPSTSMCNSRIMSDWVCRNFSDSKDGKRLLILDSFRGHLTDEMKTTCHQHGVIRAVIPAGMTSVLQPLDLTVNRSFKTIMRNEFNQLLRQYLRVENGTIESRNVDLITKCVHVAWSRMSSTTIKNGFERMYRT